MRAQSFKLRVFTLTLYPSPIEGEGNKEGLLYGTPHDSLSLQFKSALALPRAFDIGEQAELGDIIGVM